MATNEVPDIVIGRLPIYLRALTLLDKAGKEYTSSQELGQRLGIGSAQIHKDLSHFGEFGKQGTGYEIKYLREQILKILPILSFAFHEQRFRGFWCCQKKAKIYL